jgi:TatD DNase family protein
MPLIDTHAHLHEPTFEHELPDILRRAKDNGLVAIVSVGTDLASSQWALRLAAENPLVWAAVGIHPNYVSKAQPEDWDEILKLARHEKVVAIGETGLDRYWDYAPFDLQREYFARHIALSNEIHKPFIVHCRDAEPDVIEVLQSFPDTLHGVMHSFCGSLETAKFCLDKGLYISYSGMITYKKNDTIREIAKQIPRDRLMVETDCPYLAPVPHRGQRNEPAFVANVAEMLGDTLNLLPREIGELTTNNALRFLNLEGRVTR